MWTIVFESAIPTAINNTVEQHENRNLNDLTSIRLEYWSRVMIGQLNISSIGNKFDFSCFEIGPNLNLLLVWEAKLDDFFLTVWFLMSGYCKLYRVDSCSNGGSLLLYIRKGHTILFTTEYKATEM